MKLKTVDTQQRLLAALIDLVIVVGLSWIWLIGWVAATAYWLLRDIALDGQSVGKRICKLKVVRLKPANAVCTWKASILRNLLLIIPLVNIVFAIAGLTTILRQADGRHWGDLIADTRVVPAA